jgi:hypothetical protein
VGFWGSIDRSIGIDDARKIPAKKSQSRYGMPEKQRMLMVLIDCT